MDMSTHTLEHLSEVLEKRAKAWLDRDLLALNRYIEQSGLDLNKGPQLKMTGPDGSDLGNVKPVTLFFILKYDKLAGSDYIHSSPYMDELRADLLPGYRERVIQDFLAKVDTAECRRTSSPIRRSVTKTNDHP